MPRSPVFAGSMAVDSRLTRAVDCRLTRAPDSRLTRALERLRRDAHLIGVAPSCTDAASLQDAIVTSLGDPDSDHRRGRLITLLGRAERLHERERLVQRESIDHRYEALARGGAELHRCSSVAELVERVTEIALDACTAARAVLARREGDIWTPWKAAPALREDEDRELLRATAGRPPGTEATTPVLARLVVNGSVAGLLLVEHGGRRVEAGDVATVHRFAEISSLALECLEVRQRLRTLTETVDEMRDTVKAHALNSLEPRAELSRGETWLRQHRGEDDSLVVPRSPAALTDRQTEVLRAMASGSTNAEIAQRLFISVPTVKSHVREILRGFGATNRAEAIGEYLKRPDGSQVSPLRDSYPSGG